MSRLIISLIAFLLMGFFRKKYSETKESNTPNYYYFGNFLFFLANGIIILVVGIEEAFVYYGKWDINLASAKFDWVARDTSQLLFLENLGENPIYVIIIIFSLCIFAAQIYPLERLLKRKLFISKLLVVEALLCGAIFVPFLTYTYYEFGILLISFITLFMGFLINFILTGKIIKESAGIVRKRAILNITGFSLYLVGLIWSMRVGWTKGLVGLFGMDGNLDQDVLVGNFLIFLAILLYWRGFSAKD